MATVAEMRQPGLIVGLHEALRRRANHLHRFNVARIKPASAPVAGFLNRAAAGFATYHRRRCRCIVARALAEAVEPYPPESIAPATSLRPSIAVGSSSIL